MGKERQSYSNGTQLNLDLCPAHLLSSVCKTYLDLKA